ncbi:class I SAM-dependent methyltransferase [Sneathiella sp.]|uniref:class I SAM-dependent methyltransferase n=1 Tax=Sneathiella sp. TaxID=1964365 RepID=UPI002FDF60B1
MTRRLRCRFCETPLTHTFVNLGRTPLANSYLRSEAEMARERSYPLHARVCSNCFLVQVEDVVPAEEIFSDYAYFSSYSSSWVAHARRYAEKMTAELGLGSASLVAEIASNDGYLLRHFVDKGIPVLGIEPAANVAKVAEEAGVRTDVAFFGINTAKRLAASGPRADLIAANNVMAHVPDINDFIGGVPILLAPEGVFTIEFPHLLNLIEKVQFDTIYHEHYSYLSLLTTEKILAAHGLRVFDVEELPTHGGSLRIYAAHKAATRHAESERLLALRAKEAAAGLHTLAAYEGFTPKVEHVRARLLAFLQEARAEGKTVAGYGAAAKGNTLLNYCGVVGDLISFVVDRNPEKQNTYLPGSHIPVFAPEKIYREKPDYVLILPWNLADEIILDMADINAWGGKFAIPIPELQILS